MLARIGWAANGDSLDVARAANALASAGAAVWWCPRAERGAEAGDYLADLPRRIWSALADTGLTLEPWRGGRPADARRIGAPRIALLAGRASAYPYFAFYSLCLTRLGFTYTAVDGRMIADGVLDRHDVLVLPGGFSNWGLDRGERVTGADAAARRFLRDGGTAIGSCGGAYYLSAGRPGWSGVAAALPRGAHEHLLTGTGIVSLAMADDELGAGLPPSIDLPYVHGPVYRRVGKGVRIAASFEGLVLPGRVFIDNPLTARKFEDKLAGGGAILRAEGARGRAVIFSPHPELGDLWRKYVAFDGYVRRYLPIRGRAVMEDTMANYMPLESPCFRLVLNAIHLLAPVARDARRVRANAGKPSSTARFGARARQNLRRLVARLGSDERSGLAREIGKGLERRLAESAARSTGTIAALDRAAGPHASELNAAWSHLAAAGLARPLWSARRNGRMADALLEGELVAALHESFAALAGMLRVVRRHGGR